MGSKSGGNYSSSSNNNGGGGLDYWRDFFRRSNSDIFDIIEQAIMVAASDCPKKFGLRRERIAELLFTCRLTRCLGCNRVELRVSEMDDEEVDDDDDDNGSGFKIEGINDDDHGGSASKESKMNSTSRDDDHGDVGEMEMNKKNTESGFSYGDAEALTDEIEEEKEIVGEVWRIKDVLLNSHDESDSVLFESLRRLQLMALTVDILKETEIGKAVNRIRKHSSKEIRYLARALIEGWKIMVDEWVKATQELAEGGTPDSVNPSTVDEEEGLPSPPMDEGAFFSTQTMELSQFFDGMDDDGNPRSSGEFNKNREVGRKPSLVKQDAPKQREEPPKQMAPVTRDNKVQQMKMQDPLPKPNKPLNTQSGPGRPLNPNRELKVSKDSKIQPKLEKPTIQRKPVPQPEKARSPNEDAAQEKKLEATKRKLQERYQQVENAKRQRTIQVMDIQDLPKQGLANKNTFGRFGNYNRNWANGRR